MKKLERHLIPLCFILVGILIGIAGKVTAQQPFQAYKDELLTDSLCHDGKEHTECLPPKPKKIRSHRSRTCPQNRLPHLSISPTVGDKCTHIAFTGGQTYLKDDKICVEMHKVQIPEEEKGWTIVYVVGMHDTAIFEHGYDALVWAKAQPYIRSKDQIR